MSGPERWLRDTLRTPWDLAPRPRELSHPAGYWRGARLHRRLHAEGLTMVSSRRGRALHRLAGRVEHEGVPGALVDCGVWNGGSTVLLATAAPERQVWAFDSFEGMPPPGPLDGEAALAWTGEVRGAESRLREGFERYADPSRLHVVKGWFEDTMPHAAPGVGPVALLHADCDWYESVLLTLRTFWPQIVPGGFVVIDDYGDWVGARRAVEEFRAEVGETTPLTRTDSTGRYWRKA